MDRFKLIGITHFRPSEFACKCRGRFCMGAGDAPDSVMPWSYTVESALDSNLLVGLERLRYLGGNRPLRIVSGIRCSGYQAVVNPSVGNSQHLHGRAADIWCPEPARQQQLVRIARTIDEFRLGGIGRYDKFIHVDVRWTADMPPARWDLRSR